MSGLVFFLQNLFQCDVNIVPVWDEGLSLVVFATVLCEKLEGERRPDRLSSESCHGWKEWSHTFFSGARHFFKPQTV